MADWATILKTLTIEKGVPLPKRVTREVGELRAKLDALEIGDSVFVDRPDDWPDDKRFLPLHNASKTLYGKKFAQRSKGKGIRIWRTA